MPLQRIKLSSFAYLLLTITILGYLMVIGRGILIPLVASIFFAMILYPLCSRLERGVKSRIIAIILAEVLVFGLGLGVLWFFSQQVWPFLGELQKLGKVIPDLIQQVVAWMASTFNLGPNTAEKWTAKAGTRAINYLAGNFNLPSIFLTTLGLLPIYSFLLLLYRSDFRQFLLLQVSENRRDKVNQFIQEILGIAQGYIYGLGIVILILGIFNSAGLWLIGLPYPLFWGFLAAFLAIIPYIGTFIGGLLPFLFALINLDTVWQPVMVVVLFVVVQQVEGNLITPRVIGSKVELNPLAAIIALFVFGAIWGIIGLILALPIMGIIRLGLAHIPSTKPLAYLLGSHIGGKDDQLLDYFNDSRYRLFKKLFYKSDEDP
jgi:predicted PurR-regulated permease PerM